MVGTRSRAALDFKRNASALDSFLPITRFSDDAKARTVFQNGTYPLTPRIEIIYQRDSSSCHNVLSSLSIPDVFRGNWTTNLNTQEFLRVDTVSLTGDKALNIWLVRARETLKREEEIV